MSRASLFSLVLAMAFAWTQPGWAQQSGVHGRIRDTTGLPLPGVTVTLTDSAGRPVTAVTNEAGEYSFAVPPGRYDLRATLSGFDDAHQAMVVAAGQPAVLDLVLALASHQEQVTVKGEAPAAVIGAPGPATPETATRTIIDNGMLPNSQVEDVLPLLPNVVRGPDGLISVAGARAPQGALFVNGFNETDPISGDPGLFLPIEAVDALDVFSGAYSAELGRATGGVTAIHTRPGADKRDLTASSFFPRMRFTGGRLNGVDSWEPNAGLSGPLLKGRAWYEGAISYRFDRNKFGTVVGTQDQQYRATTGWLQVDTKVSPHQQVTLSFAMDPQHTDHASITAFTPSASVPGVDRTALTAAVGDHVTIGDDITIDVHAGYLRTAVTLTPDGSDPYIVGHDVVQGSYFDRQDTHGARGEFTGAFTYTARSGHVIRAGAEVGHSTLTGSDASSPVSLLRDDGSLSRLITFTSATAMSTAQNDGAVFVQDLWAVSSRMTVDAGVRYDRQGGIGGAFSPRLAWTAKWPSTGTTIGASIGIFTDKVPLKALAFSTFAPRVVQVFDATGAALGAPQLFTNTLAGPLVTPSATRWDVELDHPLTQGWRLRVKYQERDGRHEPIIVPVALSDTTGLLALSTTGSSRSRSVEMTAAYHSSGGDEICLSYVRSSSRGDLNSFDAIEGDLREPFVQANQVGPLSADVPNRLLAWGVVHLPWRVAVAPFVEVRDGFPYSVVNGDWLYVGPRDGARLPWFGSLDLYVNKIVHLPLHLPEARIGVKVYSLATVHSERDIQRDITRLDFGTVYNPIPRDVTGVLELLWGKK